MKHLRWIKKSPPRPKAPNTKVSPFPRPLAVKASSNAQYEANEATDVLRRWTALASLLAPARRHTVGLYDRVTSTLSIHNPDCAQGEQSLQWSGLTNASFLSGDWVGSGREGPGFYLHETSEFLLFEDYRDQAASVRFCFSEPGGDWLPLRGDWDGNGSDGVGLFSPEKNTLRILSRPWVETPGHQFILRKKTHDLRPAVGDWLGRGSDTLALLATSSSEVFLHETLTIDPPDHTIALEGISTDSQLILGDWWGSGFDALGIYSPSTAEFHLYLGNTQKTSFAFGPPQKQDLQAVALPWPLI